MHAPEPAAPLKWYYRPAWVLALLFLFLGPLGLPFLWKSPKFSRVLKVVLTIFVVAYFTVLVGETIRVFRAVMSELDVLGTDF